MRIQNTFSKKVPTLFLITTPIGNLSTISNAIKPLLEKLQFLFCEDTRQTQKLLNHLRLNHLKLISFHKFNEANRQLMALKLLNQNHDIGLVSCAGVPLIADPGYQLVNQVLKHHFAVTSVGLNNSGLAALITSGLPTNRFSFMNFLATSEAKKTKLLNQLITIPTTFVFFESVHRLKFTLQLFQKLWPKHTFSLARELTKRYETIYRGQFSMLKLKDIKFKGEFVLVVDNNELNLGPDLINLRKFETVIKNLNLTNRQKLVLGRKLLKLPRQLLIKKFQVPNHE